MVSRRLRWTIGRSTHILITAFVTLASVEMGAQSRPPAPEEVEAAYLFQFARYVEWPRELRSATTPFLICVLGTDPFGSALDDIVRGKVLNDRQVVTRRILGPSDAEDCRILFVSPSEDSRAPAILKALEGSGILTVGRGAQFTLRGGMIAFTSEDKKVRFVVNLAAAEAEKLRLSSQLLRVAVSVEK